MVLRYTGPGVWWIRSVENPHCNCSGVTEQLGGYYGPKELGEKFKELKERFGKLPKDIKWQSLPANFIAKVMEKVEGDTNVLQALVGISDDEIIALNKEL